MGPSGEYCAFTKAVEHLADRWSLLIVRELAIHGSLGFNALADALPGVSRSVLSRRLRKLEDLGLIERQPKGVGQAAPHRLAPAGEQLVPTLLSLSGWAERWLPQGPGVARRDPTVMLVWIARQVDVDAVPPRPVVLEFELPQAHPDRSWLVMERGTQASVCREDPGLQPDRYVYVEADAKALDPLSRGLRDWSTAIADGSVTLYGAPDLVRAVPEWFRRPGAEARLAAPA